MTLIPFIIHNRNQRNGKKVVRGRYPGGEKDVFRKKTHSKSLDCFLLSAPTSETVTFVPFSFSNVLKFFLVRYLSWHLLKESAVTLEFLVLSILRNLLIFDITVMRKREKNGQQQLCACFPGFEQWQIGSWSPSPWQHTLLSMQICASCSPLWQYTLFVLQDMIVTRETTK